MLIRRKYNAPNADVSTDKEIVISHQHPEHLAEMLNSKADHQKTKQDLCDQSRVQLKGCKSFFETMLEKDKNLSIKASAALRSAIQEDESHLEHLQREEKKFSITSNSNTMFSEHKKETNQQSDRHNKADELKAKREKNKARNDKFKKILADLSSKSITFSAYIEAYLNECSPNQTKHSFEVTHYSDKEQKEMQATLSELGYQPDMFIDKNDFVKDVHILYYTAPGKNKDYAELDGVHEQGCSPS